MLRSCVISCLVACLLILGHPETVWAEDPPSFQLQWGMEEGSADGAFFYPTGIAVDGAGNVYVADSGNRRIQKFSPDGDFIAKWDPHDPPDTPYWPADIAVTDAGRVFVLNPAKGRVEEYDSNGTWVRQWPARGTPYEVAVDHAGTYVCYRGGPWHWWRYGSSGMAYTEWSLFISSHENGDGLAVVSNGNVFATLSGAIHEFGYYGALLNTLPFSSDAKGMACDLDDNLYVSSFQSIEKIALDGSPIWRIASSSAVPISPLDLTVGPSHSVYILQRNPPYVLKFADATTTSRTTTWGQLKQLYK